MSKIIEETKKYMAFLEKRLASSNYKKNVSKQEYDKEKEKLDKARLRVKLLK